MNKPEEHITVLPPTMAAPLSIRPIRLPVWVRLLLGTPVGAVLGGELVFAFFLFQMLPPHVVHFDQVYRPLLYWMSIGAMTGAGLGAIGSLYWGRLVRATLAFFVMAMAGGLMGAFISANFDQDSPIPGKGPLVISKEWVIVGALVGGTFGAIRGWVGKKRKWPHARSSKQ